MPWANLSAEHPSDRNMFHRKEAKQQGAIEAAQNKESTVTSEDAEKVIIEETKKAGGAAFQFDPDATPEEKAAQARARVPEGFHHERNPKALGVVSDADLGGGPDFDLPSPSKAGAVEAPPANANGKPAELTDDLRWARDRTGWAPRFGQGDPADDEGPTLLDHQTWMEGKVDEKWFGDWYYNAGIIIFACLSTHVATILGGGLASVFIILAFCATYYRTSLRRVRRNFRDDIQREMAKARLENDHESLEWINSFLVKFWPIYAPVLCDTIINSVDQVLSTSTPAFLDSLRMKTFVLGTKPPRLEHVKTYPKADDDTVLMDWKFSFNPNDTMDLTARQLKNKINPKVVLEVRVGKGLVSKGLDVIVEDFAFSGLMRVKVKLQIPFPHIERAEICFLGRPEIDYVCKPLGGDMFGFDIGIIPGLNGFIEEQIHGNLEPIMYAPNVFPIEVAKMLAGAVDQAIGIVQVTLHGGKGLRNPDKYPGIPDPYVNVSINGRDIVGKTKTIMENDNPQWNETINVIVTSLKDSLTLQVFDYNEFRKDKELGTCTFPLDKLEEEQEHENLQLEVMSTGKSRGIVSADVRFFPVLEGAKDESGVEQVPESNTGIAKFTVEQAKELDGEKSLIGQLSPYAILLINGKQVQTSQVLKRTNNPIWPNASKELLITDRKSAKLGLVIKDDRGLTSDPTVGTYQVKLDDMLELMERGQEWYNLAGVKTGRAKMTLQWKPVALKGGVGGSGGYIKPIGVMRFHIKNAKDLRNLETVGKSDPYVRVLQSGIEKARTVTFFSNLNPEWDEVLYVPMHSTREKLVVEVMDTEKVGKDRSLGSFEVNAADYMKQEENGEYATHAEKLDKTSKLTLSGRGERGTVNYTVSFYPTVNVLDPEEEEKEKGEDEAGAKKSTDSARKSFESTRSRNSGMIPSLHKANGSLDSTKAALAANEKEQKETQEVQSKEPPKVKITADDLPQYETGLIIFKITEVSLARPDCYIEVIMDDNAFPAFNSSRIKGRAATLNETSDAIVRELDVSEVTLRLVEKVDRSGENNEDKVYAKLKGHTLDILKNGLYQSTPLVLRGEDGRENKVTVELKYLPIKMQLDPSESINNSGTLVVKVLDAAELPAADRNGFSDPYCKFIMAGKTVYTTNIQKKTLHPSWNEQFEVDVRSRTARNFKVECWDWDRADKDDILGNAEINLEVLEPFQAQDMTLTLDGKSGVLKLNMVFKPSYVTRTRQGTSTFRGTFAEPGKIVGAPVKGIGKGAAFVGGSVFKGASFVGRGFRSRKSMSPSETDTASQSDVIQSYPPSSAPKVTVDGAAEDSKLGTPQASHKRVSSYGSTLAGVPGSSSGVDAGMATFTIESATGFKGDNIRVFISQLTPKGPKELHKTKTKDCESAEQEINWESQNETFRVNCTPDTQFKVEVKSTHTFGKDETLGEGLLVVADQNSSLQPGTAGVRKEVRVGEGTVNVRSNFQQADQASLASASPSATGVNSPNRRASRRFGFSPRNRNVSTEKVAEVNETPES